MTPIYSNILYIYSGDSESLPGMSQLSGSMGRDPPTCHTQRQDQRRSNFLEGLPTGTDWMVDNYLDLLYIYISRILEGNEGIFLICLYIYIQYLIYDVIYICIIDTCKCISMNEAWTLTGQQSTCLRKTPRFLVYSKLFFSVPNSCTSV